MSDRVTLHGPRDPGPPGYPPAGPAIVVMGVSGSGKSTVGAALAEALSVPFVDGDALHPAENVAKMSAGIPLTDEDRWPWLAAVGQRLHDARPAGMVIACSALRRGYRDVIARHAPAAFFLLLEGSRDVLLRYLGHRRGHFMPVSLLDSQLATLEPLAPDEPGASIDIDAPLDIVVRRALAALPAAGGARTGSPDHAVPGRPA